MRALRVRLLAFDRQSGFFNIGLILVLLHLLILWPQHTGLKHLDSYEFLAQSEQLGICHPPGYSIFTLMGFVFVTTGKYFGASSQDSLLYGLYFIGLLSFLSLNWLSWKYSNSGFVCIFFGISLLQCKAFQFAANTIEVYGLVAFLFGLLLISIHWQQIPWFKYFIGGVLISHHTTAGPAVLIILYFHRQESSRFLKHFIWLLMGPLIHCSYLSFRASSKLNYWFDFSSLYEHFYHFSARLYSIYLGPPTVSSFRQNIEVFIQNFSVWNWVLILLIVGVWSVNKFKTSMVECTASLRNYVDWIPRKWILIVVLSLEFGRNLCYHIPDIYSHTMILSICILLISVRLCQSFGPILRFSLCFLSVFGVISYPTIYDRVDEIVDLQKLSIEDAKILESKSSEPIFVANTVMMFPMMKLASDKLNIADRLVPDWAFENQGSYGRLRRRLSKNSQDISLVPYPLQSIGVSGYSLFKDFLITNRGKSSIIYLAALYARDARLGSDFLDFQFINRGMWNELLRYSEGVKFRNPVLLVVTGYVDKSKRFQFTRNFDKNMNPVVSLYLRQPVNQSFVMQWEWGDNLASREVQFVKQPSHFQFDEFNKEMFGLIKVRFLDPHSRQLLSEVEIQKSP